MAGIKIAFSSYMQKIKQTSQLLNLNNYKQICHKFVWQNLFNSPGSTAKGKGLNIAFEAVDRHGDSLLGNHTAICWVKDQKISKITYKELKALTNQFANILQMLKIKQGQVICLLTGRIPELWISALGILKYKAVFCPLFSDFGQEPIFQRLKQSNASVLVTTQRIYQQKIYDIKSRLPNLKHVLLVDSDKDLINSCVYSLPNLMKKASTDFIIPHTNHSDQAILHFTSGTTGTPKGVIHVHNAVAAHYITGKYVFNLNPGDIFWCSADPGWVTGTSYGIISPLVNGVTNIINGADFNAQNWLEILEKQQVNAFYTSPSALRRLMRMGNDLKSQYDLSRLRQIASVGEPLSPDIIIWGQKSLGITIQDTWWQTETGAIMIANYPEIPVKPGSMGLPMPGIEIGVFCRNPEGSFKILKEPGTTGYLGIKKGWPSMFKGYLNNKTDYEKCFAENWYITRDQVKCDSQGYYWFVGRSDDIIKTSGYMAGPFEIEQVLTSHYAVEDAGVIGISDEMCGEIVKAFIQLKTGFSADEQMKKTIMGFARKKLGAALSPREIEFINPLPKNKSGKIMRRLLKLS